MRPFVGIGVFVKRNGRILLGLRKSESHGGGQWSLPGGHLEHGESFEDCCRREVFEETGLTLGSIEKVGFTNDLFPEAGLHYVTLYFAAVQATGALVNREPHKCVRWEWFSPDALPRPLFCGIEEVIPQLRRGW